MKLQRSQQLDAIIMKRVNVGEKDRIITLLSQQQGKITVIAKGSRSMLSSRCSVLEPGMYIKAGILATKGMPYLLEVNLQEDFIHTKSSLPKMKQLFQVLEMFDRLIPDQEVSDAFDFLLEALHLMNTPQNQFTTIKHKIESFIESMGYQHPSETQYHSLTEYVSVLADRPMNSYRFLSVSNNTNLTK